MNYFPIPFYYTHIKDKMCLGMKREGDNRLNLLLSTKMRNYCSLDNSDSSLKFYRISP